MAGRYFNQWQIGDNIVHEIRRTVTETDNLLFSVMTHNPQPLHIDVLRATSPAEQLVHWKGAASFPLEVSQTLPGEHRGLHASAPSPKVPLPAGQSKHSLLP